MKTFEEIWSRYSPKFDHLRIFGYIAYAHIRQGKLDVKSMFFRYSKSVKGYFMWCL